MTRTMTSRIPADRKRALRLAAALIGLAVALGACKHTADEVTTASVPDDYRLRHPIAIQEADRSIVVFVGRGRGGLSAPQRADVMGLAQTWLHEGTGGISIDMPVDTPNARAATGIIARDPGDLRRRRRAAARQSMCASTVREDPRHMAAIRLNYPKISADRRPLRPLAGGSRTVDPQQELFRKQALLQFRLRQPAQHGGDGRQSVRPRAAAARNAGLRRRAAHRAFEKYRKGTATATTYPEADKAKLSDIGK